eukprot:TRINITY_DN3904_c1_g1_i1.p1 TRINITY_DN3904_c1_g1~~TRINITY_DN3904_c1_g1_i1.p1  ORF type:complete len:184 (+),score=24.82 TRINITY_DN3904_c1_g1_i1:139-690(+)
MCSPGADSLCAQRPHKRLSTAVAALIGIVIVSRAEASSNNFEWTKYLDGVDMPRSVTWREKMRKELNALNLNELTPALKMKRVQLLRKFDAEDNRPPPTDGAYSNFDPDAGTVDPLPRTPPIQFDLQTVLKGGAVCIVVAVAISFLVPNFQQMIMEAGQASARGGGGRGRTRGRQRKSQDEGV